MHKSGARTEIRLDGYGRKRRHGLLLLIGWKMGFEIWAQTHTHNTDTHTHTLTHSHKTANHQKKAIIDTRRHWDGNGLYSPPGANLVHLAHLFRSFTKHAFSAGTFFFSFFFLFVSLSFYFACTSRDGTTGAKLFGRISCNWAELHQPLYMQRGGVFYFILGKG